MNSFPYIMIQYYAFWNENKFTFPPCSITLYKCSSLYENHYYIQFTKELKTKFYLLSVLFKVKLIKIILHTSFCSTHKTLRFASTRRKSIHAIVFHSVYCQYTENRGN